MGNALVEPDDGYLAVICLTGRAQRSRRAAIKGALNVGAMRLNEIKMAVLSMIGAFPTKKPP